MRDSEIAFIKGRSSFERWMVIAEVLDVMKSVENGLVFKIDLEKTYICVDWDFLWFFLGKMGYGEMWIRWIKRSMMCACISMLVNRSVGRELMMERELSQGCHFVASSI